MVNKIISYMYWYHFWFHSNFVCNSAIHALRKHAYSNTLKTLPPKNENFQIKNSDIFLYFCSKHRLWVLVRTAVQRGGSNEYPQSMYLSRNKKNNVYPFKPQFNYMKVGFKGVKII